MSARVVPVPLSISNAFLLLSDRPALVDSGSPGDEAAIEAALSAQGLRPRDLAVVVLTHGHTDHTGTLAVFADAGVPIVVAAADAERVRTGRNGDLPATGPVGVLMRPMTQRMAPTPVVPDVTFEHRISLEPYGVDAHAEVVGGHTAGSSVVRCGGDVLVGDLVRGGFAAGRISPGHPLRHYFMEDPAGVRRALAAELEQGPGRLHLGHGGPLNPAVLRSRLDKVAPVS